ncbi:hypothetical protein IWX50DRAFT_631397 [Phyllosticta citricarpa]
MARRLRMAVPLRRSPCRRRGRRARAARLMASCIVMVRLCLASAIGALCSGRVLRPGPSALMAPLRMRTLRRTNGTPEPGRHTHTCAPYFFLVFH